MKKIFISIILFIVTWNLYSQNYSSFLNLRIGNKYFYYCFNEISQSPYQSTAAHKMRIIIDDTISYNGKKYYHYTRELIRISGTINFRTYSFLFNIGDYTLIRLDTLTGKVFYYNPGIGCGYSPDENMIDSLNVKLNDIVHISCAPTGYNYDLNCIDTSGTRKFAFGTNIQREYKQNTGLFKNRCYLLIGGGYLTDEQTLIGSIINGIVSGDTTFESISSINIKNTSLPQFYSLSQNYPNPFNPVTYIKFSIPKSGFVKLTIYDMLGKEVETLLNRELQTGTYQADWNATSYPSGVYYYRLESENYTETKKMVLIK